MNESEFIETNKQKPVTELALLLSKKPELDSTYILAQINGIQKAKNKLPEFYNEPDIVYPTKLSIEQCSSEQTAIFKSKLITGNTLVDLTGGFGIDSYYFAKQFEQVTYIEHNKELFNAVKQNFEKLKADNIHLINSSAEDFLKNKKEKVDIIYIDPSRRNENQRVFKLDECTPNILELAPEIFKIADIIMVKTAPLLDIKQTLKDLKHVTKVWVVSVNNDCKEVLYLLEKDKEVNPQIQTINCSTPNQEFDFNFTQESSSNIKLSSPENYLYESNTSILKAGAFNSVCDKYNVKKLGKNTHLYTSQKIVENFPGRTFKIETVIPYQAKEFKKLGISKANVSTRNHKDSVEQIKKKLKLLDGGDIFLFAVTDLNNKPILVICVK
jgi:16S rRNA G966 N2-methylase RsmD